MTGDKKMFFKKTCRLCETHEPHTTGSNCDDENCRYWLKTGDDSIPRIEGYTKNDGIMHEFWIPVLHCPWCGKEL